MKHTASPMKLSYEKDQADSESNLAFRAPFQFAGNTEDEGTSLTPQGSNQTNPEGGTQQGTTDTGVNGKAGGGA